MNDESAWFRSPDLARIVTVDGRRQVWLRDLGKPQAKARLVGCVAVLDPVVVGLAHDGKSWFAFDVASLEARPLEVPTESSAIHAAAVDWRRQTVALATGRGVAVFALAK